MEHRLGRHVGRVRARRGRLRAPFHRGARSRSRHVARSARAPRAIRESARRGAARPRGAGNCGRARGGVRFVLDPLEARRLRVLEERCARKREERAIDPHPRARERAHLRHRSDALQPGAAQQLQQHRLGLVVEVVRERDDRLVTPRVDGIARAARRAFQPLGGAALDMHALDRERHAAFGAEALAECGPRVGVGAEAVMHVHRANGSPRLAAMARHEVEKHRRIEAAGEPHAHRGARRQAREAATRPVP